MTPYQRLEARFRRLGQLDEAIRLLQWDAAAVMPEGGAGGRAEQLAALRLCAREILAAPEISDLLAAAETESATLDPWQRANLREMRRRWRHRTAVPAELVAARSRACSECEMVWRRARRAGDFSAVLPAFARVLSLTRELADAKAAALDLTPYEALIDQYEPGIAVATIDSLFADLVRFLPDLVEEVLARQKRLPAAKPLVGPFPAAAQRRAAMRLMERLGFDFAHGRLDESAHPFCGGTQDDVRITTRWNEEDFFQGLMAVLHETGHALYKRALPAAWRWQPVGAARGMAVHESQSLLLEMQVCRSRAFLGFALPLLQAELGEAAGAWDADRLYRRATNVGRTLIRVEADEVTYPLHVILRYRLERAMIAGDLEPRDLPDAWAEGLALLLAVRPGNDREGCLQDIHWYEGFWGYFPTYTLGALLAAQLFAAARREIPGLEDGIAAGRFAPLFDWLGARVHGRGSLLPTAELVESATGAPLGTASFERHLRARYLA
ncbi:MAG TPA: carboxypeptidase M32 [Stellaceae bacterium]|nr:carboxypeptidase M32 [Stellaceae bacterium]